MTTVLILIIAGILTGALLRKQNATIRISKILSSTAIFLLLFLLGISVGVNKHIMSNIKTIGIEALTITIGAIAGSIFICWLIYRYFFHFK